MTKLRRFGTSLGEGLSAIESPPSLGERGRFKPERNPSALIYRIGGAYMMPPLFHKLLRPRGSFSAEFGPTLRSKISP